MRRCAGCGGVLGRDCWNESDCVWITSDMQARASEQQRDPRADACHGCSWIATEGGYVDCLGLCTGATCQEDIDARRALWITIPTTFGQRPTPPGSTTGQTHQLDATEQREMR